MLNQADRAREVLAALSDTQRNVVASPVRGVIGGLFFVASEPTVLIELHMLGLCSRHFDPTDFAQRGHRHAAKITDFGRTIAKALEDLKDKK